jgi:cell division cycle protein 20 (cofactor of APC complex)
LFRRAGKHISVGTASATVQIWDASRCKQIRSLKGHAARVSALAWNKNTLSSGGRDSTIINHDVRCGVMGLPHSWFVFKGKNR